MDKSGKTILRLRSEKRALEEERDRYKAALEEVVKRLGAWDRFREVRPIIDAALSDESREEKK